jgi:ribA/ribD-fused uncharacterized protein
MTHYNRAWLAEKFENGDALNFLHFWGHAHKTNEAIGKFCLSQWFAASFTVDGTTYATAEHWMMAQKALLFSDDDIFKQIINSTDPKDVKALGRKIKGFDNDIWDKNKYEIVKQGNIYKFSQNQALAYYLLQTGDAIIVEASPVDPIWGIGMAQNHSDIDNVLAWRGENLLGFALMETRDFLKNT